jgi:predicted tellurium resistance membrane protein TerC
MCIILYSNLKYDGIYTIYLTERVLSADNAS